MNAENWAIRLKSPHTSPKHILLGLLEGKDTTAVQILEQIAIDIFNLKAELESQLMAQASAQPSGSHPTLTPLAKHVLVRAADEAMDAGDSYIDTAHALWGLLEEKQGLVSKLLAHLGVFCEDVRRKFFEKV
ncbi:MAG: hypothetical protein N2116_04385 [Armatimonadetes bacterium]|nr:hypothetical protein [Armatimonadota bacterium]